VTTFWPTFWAVTLGLAAVCAYFALAITATCLVLRRRDRRAASTDPVMSRM
jgi:hypothetical protein